MIIAMKHNSLRTFPYAIKKNSTKHQSDIKYKCPVASLVKSLMCECELVYEKVTKQLNQQNSTNKTRNIH